ncbi:autotransporter outer membrane beta-barrel domain-containing protein, partial [Planococcus sp. SIMBA_143]
GIMAGFADQNSKTKNNLNGYYSKGKTTGYSAGLYGTWYADDADKSGLYTDAWVLYNWCDHEVHSEQFSAEKYTSRGVTASVE